MEEFLALREMIYARSGIFFPESKLYLLEGRLAIRLNELELEGFKEYLIYLKDIRHLEREMPQIFNLVTINETYFFRYPSQLDIYSKVVLPELIKRGETKGQRAIKMWSAASSSGEEAYTMAMLTAEGLGHRTGSWDVSILATDISSKILDLARQGIYGPNSFRGNVSPYYQTKYFIPNSDRFKVNTQLESMVRFDHLNLSDFAKIRSLRGMDVVFCRNVLIYFDKEMKRQLLKSLYNVLNHGGYLFLGEAESLHGISSSFQVIHHPGAFVYKKE